MCIDFRALNKVTERDHYPMPRIDDLLHASGKAAVFSSIDLRWVYWLIPLRAEYRPKAAFITPFGLYQWRIMAFGLINAGAMCQRLAGLSDFFQNNGIPRKLIVDNGPELILPAIIELLSRDSNFAMELGCSQFGVGFATGFGVGYSCSLIKDWFAAHRGGKYLV